VSELGKENKTKHMLIYTFFQFHEGIRL